jgi:CDP-6-deoxy-D-xylo-4-hexulose-3-dehydrase
MSRPDPAELRRQILDLAGRYHEAAFPPKPFVPGQTPVPVSGKVLDGEDLRSLLDSALDLWLTAGRFAEAFERKFAETLGGGEALLVNSGSSANLLALAVLAAPELGERALRPGDEVLTLAAGFPTTVNPIYQQGLVPVYLDVTVPEYAPDPDALESALSPRTRALFLPHTLGNPFEAERIRALADRRGLWLIEDCCDALGATHRGRPVGTFGHLAAFSFYPAHHITTGEGGAVLTRDPLLADLVRSYRDWGRDCRCAPGQDNRCGRRYTRRFGTLPEGYDHKYVYSHLGYNLKATDMQAAVGLSQLDKLPGFIRRRRENFAHLAEGLRDLEEHLILPRATPDSEPSWFGLPLALREEAPYVREDLLRFLEARRIGARLLFGGNLTRQPAYLGLSHRIAGDLSRTDFVMRRVFWLGVFPGLTGPMRDYVLESLHDFFRGSPR